MLIILGIYMYLYSISKCLMFVSFRLVMNICSCGINVVRDRRLLVFDLEDIIILYIVRGR